MTLVIVGIHGLANKPPRNVLARWWEDAIGEGLEVTCGKANPDFEFRMVYWADLLYKHLLHRDKSFDFDRLYNDEPYVKAGPGAIKAYEDGWIDDARRISQMLGGKLLDALKDNLNIDAAANWLLDKTMKDLAFYYDKNRKILDRNGDRRQARQVLMDELTGALLALRGQRIMVIAHSMGSIIAYDVLRNIGRRSDRFDVDYFVTIGSPLGLPHVKANIYEERKSYAPAMPVRTPTIVAKGWVNLADRLDPVAFDSHLGDDYGRNDRGIAVRDDLVRNDYLAPGRRPNRHKSYGYLRTPELSRLIEPLA